MLVEPDTAARVVVDARTGTVVIGQDVQISTVAVTHGTLNVRITETPQVSQPAPFSQGKTTTDPAARRSTSIRPADRSRSSAARACARWSTGLNRLGVKPTGIIAILQAIKSAGRAAGRSRRAIARQPDARRLRAICWRYDAPRDFPPPCPRSRDASVATVALAAGDRLSRRARAGRPKPKARRGGADNGRQRNRALSARNFAPTAAEARIAYQTKRLAELEAQVQTTKSRSSKQDEARRARMGHKARRDDEGRERGRRRRSTPRWSAEAAAAQLARWTRWSPPAMLAKLKPRAASAILGEMDADKRRAGSRP